MKGTTTKGGVVVYLRKCTLVCSILNASFHWLIISRDGRNSANNGRVVPTSVCRLPTLELSLPALLACIVPPITAGLFYPPFELLQSSMRGGGSCISFGSGIQLSHMPSMMHSPRGPAPFNPVLLNFPLLSKNYCIVVSNQVSVFLALNLAKWRTFAFFRSTVFVLVV